MPRWPRTYCGSRVCVAGWMSFIRTVVPTLNSAGAFGSRSVGPPRQIAGVDVTGRDAA